MNPNAQLSIKSAVKGRGIEKLGRTHVTTMDFGQTIALFHQESMRGGHYPIIANYFARLAPLVKPTYGRAYLKTMTVFVPYYMVADNIDAWIDSKDKVMGTTAKGRFILVRDIALLFTANATLASQVSAAEVATGSWYDFTYKYNATQVYIKMTNIGRYIYKILTSMGYVFPQNANTHTSSSWYKGTNEGEGAYKLSALPLLAFAKAYNDWMSQSTRYNLSTLSKFLEDVKHDHTNTYGGNTCYDSSTNCISYWGILTMLGNVQVAYEDDYFTSAWQYPNAPIAGETYKPNGVTDSIDNAQLSYINNSDGLENINRNNNGTYINTDYEVTVSGEVSEEGGEYTFDGSGSFAFQLGQRALDWLRALSDFARRNNYAGSKDVQQEYARFGIKPEEYQFKYSHLLNTTKTELQIGDVTAMGQDYVSSGNANNIELGDYAGKGIINGNENVEYTTKDVGQLIILGWITVAPMNAYGWDKAVLRNKPMDYYVPEFDGIGPEPISVGEVFVNPRIWSNTESKAVFGFTERYNSYRYGFDQITGDFRKFPSLDATYGNVGTEMNTWHLGRMLNDQLTDGTLVAQNPAFNVLSMVDSEYNRIFTNTSGNMDHFYLTCQFKCDATLPCLTKNQVPRLGEGDTVITKNGQEIC